MATVSRQMGSALEGYEVGVPQNIVDTIVMYDDRGYIQTEG